MQKLFLFFTIALTGCGLNNRIYIKTTDLNKEARVHWYCNSLIADGLSTDHIEVSYKGNNTLLYVVSGVTDIYYYEFNNTLTIQLERDFRNSPAHGNILDTTNLKSLQIKLAVETNGDHENRSERRLLVLKKNKVDFSKPHYFNSNSN